MALDGLDARATSTAPIIASVVPEAHLQPAHAAAAAICNCEPLVVGEPGVELGIEALVDRPEEVGADRLVNAVGGPCTAIGGPLIVVDFGTATTFDVVDGDGNYRGGVIAPGHQSVAAGAAHGGGEAAAASPIEPRRSGHRQGARVACMQSGVFWGYVGLIEGLVDAHQGEFGAPMRVIATGGLAPLFAGATGAIEHLDPDLTLWGLALIYRAQRNRMSDAATRCAAHRRPDELLFLPLGGAGEIGMNLNLYGYARQVADGRSAASPSATRRTPGVDVIMPDPAFIVERRERAGRPRR